MASWLAPWASAAIVVRGSQHCVEDAQCAGSRQRSRRRERRPGSSGQHRVRPRCTDSRRMGSPGVQRGRDGDRRGAASHAVTPALHLTMSIRRAVGARRTHASIAPPPSRGRVATGLEGGRHSGHGAGRPTGRPHSSNAETAIHPPAGGGGCFSTARPSVWGPLPGITSK